MVVYLNVNYHNFQAYTQYIPLSIYDLQAWMGSPSIYVYDCSNAGMIVKLFNQFAEQHEKEILVSICYYYFVFVFFFIQIYLSD